jgi:PrgI family protein
MRFEVPQFIDIEDKIFGPLTWRQFLYLGGGVGMGVVLFFTANIIVFILVGLPLAVLAGALAFYPVNNRPFSFFLEAIVNYFQGTKLYLWRQKEQKTYKYSFDQKINGGETIGINKAEPNPLPKSPQVSLARRLELEAMQKTE